MEEINLTKDITVMCVTAASFPKGVIAAYTKLHLLVPEPDKRKYFGFSHPDKTGEIIYKACTEELTPGEGEKLGLETLVIKRGKFASIFIKDHMKDASAIGNAFKKLLTHPQLDPQGYCLEWYINFTDGDVRCMVPLKS